MKHCKQQRNNTRKQHQPKDVLDLCPGPGGDHIIDRAAVVDLLRDQPELRGVDGEKEDKEGEPERCAAGGEYAFRVAVDFVGGVG
jgi:hypothetical protein